MARARFLFFALAFVGWLGFLLYLVLENQQMIVLPHPQFLAAPLCVIAEVKEGKSGPDPDVTVERVVWSTNPKDVGLTGKVIRVTDLPKLDATRGFQQPGPYILPLEPVVQGGKTTYEIVPLSPHGPAGSIYPVTAQTEAQLHALAR